MADDKYTAGMKLFQTGLGTAAQLSLQNDQMKQERLKAAMDLHKAELAQGQKMWEQLQQDADMNFKLAGNDKLPKNIRIQHYMNGVAARKQIRPDEQWPGVDAWDEKVGDALDAFGVIDNMEELTPDQKYKYKNRIVAQQSKVGNVEQSNFLRAVLEDTQKQHEELTAKELQKSATISAADRIIGTVDEALAQTGLFSAGLASLTKWIPGTPAKDLDEKVSSIKATLGIDQMQQLKAMSPTGSSGFGNQSDKELAALQSAVSSLDTGQSPEQTREGLMKVAKHYKAWKEIVNKAKGQPALGSVGALGTNNAQTPPAIPVGHVEDGYTFKGGDPADKNNWVKQ